MCSCAPENKGYTEVSASAVAENTAAGAFAPVDIGAGESGVDHSFYYPFPVCMPVMVVKRVIALVIV